MPPFPEALATRRADRATTVAVHDSLRGCAATTGRSPPALCRHAVLRRPACLALQLADVGHINELVPRTPLRPADTAIVRPVNSSICAISSSSDTVFFGPPPTLYISPPGSAGPPAPPRRRAADRGRTARRAPAGHRHRSPRVRCRKRRIEKMRHPALVFVAELPRPGDARHAQHRRRQIVDARIIAHVLVGRSLRAAVRRMEVQRLRLANPGADPPYS